MNFDDGRNREPNQYPYAQQAAYPPAGYPQQAQHDSGLPQQSGDPNVSRRRFTREEMAVLKQCFRESFWMRSVPLAALGVGGLFYLRNVNKLPPKVPFGPAIAATVFGGYLIGKLSYVSTCKEKIRMLPNSPLAEALKRQERGEDVLQEMAQLPSLDTLPQFRSDDYFRSQQSPEIYHDPDFSVGQHDVDANAQDPSTNKRSTSYDELRLKNRETYWRQQAQNLKPRNAYPGDPNQPHP